MAQPPTPSPTLIPFRKKVKNMTKKELRNEVKEFRRKRFIIHTLPEDTKEYEPNLLIPILLFFSIILNVFLLWHK